MSDESMAMAMVGLMRHDESDVFSLRFQYIGMHEGG